MMAVFVVCLTFFTPFPFLFVIGAAPAAAAPQEEKTEFTIKLEGFDAASKIKVIKEVRGITDLGLKEAKDLVEGAPAVLKKGIKKEEAEEIKAKLEAGKQLISFCSTILSMDASYSNSWLSLGPVCCDYNLSGKLTHSHVPFYNMINIYCSWSKDRSGVTIYAQIYNTSIIIVRRGICCRTTG